MLAPAVAVAIAALLAIGSALAAVPGTPTIRDAFAPVAIGPIAERGAIDEPRAHPAGPDVGRLPWDRHGALNGVLPPATAVAGTPDNPSSAGQAGGGRSRLPHPSWPPLPPPSVAAPAGGWLLASWGESWRPARVAGANRSIPRPPPTQR